MKKDDVKTEGTNTLVYDDAAVHARKRRGERAIRSGQGNAMKGTRRGGRNKVKEQATKTQQRDAHLH